MRLGRERVVLEMESHKNAAGQWFPLATFLSAETGTYNILFSDKHNLAELRKLFLNYVHKFFLWTHKRMQTA